MSLEWDLQSQINVISERHRKLGTQAKPSTKEVFYLEKMPLGQQGSWYGATVKDFFRDWIPQAWLAVQSFWNWPILLLASLLSVTSTVSCYVIYTCCFPRPLQYLSHLFPFSVRTWNFRSLEFQRDLNSSPGICLSPATLRPHRETWRELTRALLRFNSLWQIACRFHSLPGAINNGCR